MPSDSLYKFLSGWFGGPPLYIRERGHPRLRMRHAAFAIGPAERDQWMLCMHQALTEQVADDVRSCLGHLVFNTVIPRNVRLSEAPSHGLPALVYDHRCSGSEAYMKLARELIGRLPARELAA